MAAKDEAGPGRGGQGQSPQRDPGGAAVPRHRARGRGDGCRPRLCGWLRWPAAVWPVTAAAWAGVVALAWYLAAQALTRHRRHLLVDLHVYRNGGHAILHGAVLYSMVTNGKLLYTYPPVSAVLAVPMDLLSWHEVQILWMPMVYLPLAAVIWYAFRPILARTGRYAPAVFAVLFAGGTMLTPIRQEVSYGQVDILLVAMCAADCLTCKPRWPRGALIGLATAIKLVPGVFIIYLLITGRRKATGVAAVTFAALTGLAWLAVPADSATYWTSAIFNSSRPGPNAQVANQSLRGIVLRAFVPAPAPESLWIAVVLVVAVAGFAAALWMGRRGFAAGAVAITGLLAALLSPVAWIHHYCWIIMVIGAIAGDCRSKRRVVTAMAAGGLFASMLPSFGGQLDASGTIPALPAGILADSFGLAALGLICVISGIRVTDADRWVGPSGPAASTQPHPTRPEQVPAGQPGS